MGSVPLLHKRNVLLFSHFPIEIFSKTCYTNERIYLATKIYKFTQYDLRY